MYQALYRKWRPKTFDEVSGQPHVTLTLKNELEGGRISHAYLFTGSRGTGKTSCAKILSKAVNCLNPVNGNPCGECEICREIDSGSLLDVVEIDAASNNSVDNIRDLREEVNFTPARCKYRVYIIDEVHMLSQGAFNALLKTLEEPPAHVVFILATTEVHKLPATILSRCQRFDFRRIAPEDICQRLLHIASKEGFTLTEGAAALIARIADGGMRDAVSLLDRCCAKDSHIDESVVSAASGMADTRHLYKFSEFIANNDFAGAVSLVSKLHSEFCDLEILCSELLVHFRNIMIAKTVPDCKELIICSASELSELAAIASRMKLSKILSCLETLEQTADNIKGSPEKKVYFESAVVRMCSFVNSDQRITEPEVLSLVSRVEKLEKIILSGAKIDPESIAAPAAPVEPVMQEEPAAAKIPEPPAEPAEPVAPPPVFTPAVAEPEPPAPVPAAEELPPPPPPPVEAPTEQGEAPVREDVAQWPEIIEYLKKTDVPLSVLLTSTTAFISRGTKLVICTDNPLLFGFIKSESHSTELRKAIYAVTGKKLGIAIKDNPAANQVKKNPLENLKSKINEFNSNGGN